MTIDELMKEIDSKVDTMFSDYSFYDAIKNDCAVTLRRVNLLSEGLPLFPVRPVQQFFRESHF